MPLCLDLCGQLRKSLFGYARHAREDSPSLLKGARRGRQVFRFAHAAEIAAPSLAPSGDFG
jgi:hypothetical protein